MEREHDALICMMQLLAYPPWAGFMQVGQRCQGIAAALGPRAELGTMLLHAHSVL